MVHRPGSTLRVIATATALWLSGCDAVPPNSCACTEEFRTFAIVVVNAAGAPVLGLTPTVTLVRTGEPITPPDPPYAGHYAVFSDAELSLIQSSAEAVRFVVAGNQGSGAAELLFSTTACRCHIQKVSGPDTLVLQ